uniref:Uncharacterized protein n=1 Tax=Mimivirus LCMiAC02 TaxID=2506609 RepID=A0A481Z1K0_9VIRU|nr:MAG: hypothetical protein LCMiAC02_01930 [Mimivirus LCMiAC02]
MSKKALKLDISKLSIPLSDNVIISFGKFNNNFGYFGIDYDIYNTIRRKIKKISIFSKKYEITKYHYRNLVMTKYNKSPLTYHHVEQTSYKIYDSVCITTNKIKEIDSTEIPILNKYHKTSYQSITEYEYSEQNTIVILFIEENCNNNSVYTIKLQFKNKNNNKFVVNNVQALLKIILKGIS